MLVRLAVMGFGLLSDVSLELAPGLNVVSGETGAGKSLLLSALSVLFGTSLPTGICSARVSAELDPLRLSRAQLELSDSATGNIGLVRDFSRGARGRASLNGRPIARAELAGLFDACLSITGQNSVREAAAQGAVLEALDEHADLGNLAREYRQSLLALRRTEAALQALSRRCPNSAADRPRLLQQLLELQALQPRRGEVTDLSRRIEILSRAQHYLALAQRVTEVVSDRENSVEAELRGLLVAVRRAPPVASLVQLGDEIAAALGSLDGATRQAARLGAELLVEPLELERLESRLEELIRLAERLALDPDALAGAEQQLTRALSEIDSAAERQGELATALQVARSAAQALALELHERRTRALPRLRTELGRELRVLGLPSNAVSLDLERPSDALGRWGMSRLKLGFSSNAGQAHLPLERVASGGERARLVLALACVGGARNRLLVLDEIDQGVGGEAVEAVAERLQRLGRDQQVLCVTHQAAIAARADAHFRVRKSAVGARSWASVERLTDEQRMLEISRMLAGGCAVSAAKALARRLLEAARRAA